MDLERDSYGAGELVEAVLKAARPGGGELDASASVDVSMRIDGKVEFTAKGQSFEEGSSGTLRVTARLPVAGWVDGQGCCIPPYH